MVQRFIHATIGAIVLELADKDLLHVADLGRLHHARQGTKNDCVDCHTAKHPETCDSYFPIIMCSKVTISNRCERLARPIHRLAPRHIRLIVNDASLANPCIVGKVIHRSTEIEDAREDMCA